ncbi:uncharacterized protein Dwil_GK15949 [Drosophila willistoni]|uniref:Uncharacterized protein n=1 Tax=Drosophila willistoni TaxID=7260 RepID=B4MS59_DROWI|nr:uncharacterized serine-rich protein C215.13 [Drosophila willistoni]EDW74948.2 uncharacterized protein Dwil_GK15949 [Drosophila willistoni]
MTKMAIQLDKILADIAKEKALHPNNGGSASKQEQDEAWQRIGRLNKLSVHESRSIFIVLQKKYDQEKLKPNSTWKLFNLMHQIHQEHKPPVAIKEDDEQVPMEEVEEFEMLEVQEQEEDDDSMVPPNQFSQPANSTGSGSASSDGESPSKSLSSNSPEKSEEKLKPMVDTPRPAFQSEERKLLNTMANNPRAATVTSSNNSNASSNSVSLAAAAVLQKKGITLKKTPGIQRPTSTASHGGQNAAAAGKGRTTIQLPDSLKRKLSEDYGSSSSSSQMARKGMRFNAKQTQPQQQGNQNSESSSSSNSTPAAEQTATASATSAAHHPPPPPVVHTTTAQLMQVKRERESNQTPPPGINIITIPAAASQQMNGVGATSSTAATMASTSVASTNGYSPHAGIEELDFKNDIIFESKSASNNGGVASGGEIINLGNFNNSLPPTFFKNLCNSSRHEALGLYVANVMNRISGRAAAKLELGILRAIVDVQSDELEQ